MKRKPTANRRICAIVVRRKASFNNSSAIQPFCPSLTFTIELLNKISTLVLRSAAVAGGDVEMKPPTAQMPNVACKRSDTSNYETYFMYRTNRNWYYWALFMQEPA